MCVVLLFSVCRCSWGVCSGCVIVLLFDLGFLSCVSVSFSWQFVVCQLFS